MPTRKTRLNETEMVRYRACARELRAAGLISEMPPEWAENRCPLEIETAPPPNSVVCDLGHGQICYAILVRLLAKRAGITLQECQITTSCDDHIVLATFDNKEKSIDFGGQLYQQSEILNPRVESNLRVGCSHAIEGWILATGPRPIPAAYPDSSSVPFEVTFWDVHGQNFQADGGAFVLRRGRRDETGVQRGTGLYGADPNGGYSVPSVGEEAMRRYHELDSQTTTQIPGGFADIPDQTKLMKRLIELIASPDLDAIYSELEKELGIAEPGD